MAALKFAFDTIIVGILALPWCVIIARGLFSGKRKENITFLSIAPNYIRQALASVLLAATGYFLGSVVSRASEDCFDDAELWDWRGAARETAIRESVYCQEKKLIAEHGWPVQGSVKPFLCSSDGAKAQSKVDAEAVLEIFRLQESKLQLSGEDKTARLQRLHEQITVLRGAALNGFILCILCVFGLWADWRPRLQQHATLLRWVKFLPAWVVLLVGVRWLWEHLVEVSGYSKPPIAELVVILLGVAGFFVAPHETDSRLHLSGILLGLLLAIIAYASYWSTSVLYYRDVIHSFHMLNTSALGAAQ